MKLSYVQSVLEILNPIFDGKCGSLLSLDLLDVINELQPHLDKIDKIKKKLIEEYSIKDENGNVLTKKINDSELYDFGENEDKVVKELDELYSSDIEIKAKINTGNFDNDVKIEPSKLKFLYDLGLLIK